MRQQHKRVENLCLFAFLFVDIVSVLYLSLEWVSAAQRQVYDVTFQSVCILGCEAAGILFSMEIGRFHTKMMLPGRKGGGGKETFGCPYASPTSTEYDPVLSCCCSLLLGCTTAAAIDSGSTGAEGSRWCTKRSKSTSDPRLWPDTDTLPQKLGFLLRNRWYKRLISATTVSAICCNRKYR